MSNINDLIKKLRSETGATILNCKKALETCQSDLEEARLWLRKQGIASAAKKQDRATESGLVAALSRGSTGVLMEVNCETDFVARNQDFHSLLNRLLESALEHRAHKVEDFLQKGTPRIEEIIFESVAKVGENLVCNRLALLDVEPGLVVSYVHGAVASGMGKIAVLVALESQAPASQLEELGKAIAMHIAAHQPTYLRIADVPVEIQERERNVLRAQLEGSDKPEAILEKMIEGRLQKFYQEQVLEEQAFVRDSSINIKQLVANTENEAQTPIRLAGFLSFTLGMRN